MYDPILAIRFRLLSLLLLSFIMPEALIKNIFVIAILKCTFITLGTFLDNTINLFFTSMKDVF